MIRFYKTPYLFRRIFHRRVWGFSSSNTVYLTFDDGPTPEMTQWILKVLNEANVKASFFCVGTNAKQHPELMNQIIDGGHSIGNHTMRHEKGHKVNSRDYINSIKETEEFVDSNLFRPPYGRLSRSTEREIDPKYKIIMWSWLSYDYDEKVPVDRILKNAKKQIEGGDILVLHDNAKIEERTKELLPQLINIIKAKGLKLEAISA